MPPKKHKLPSHRRKAAESKKEAKGARYQSIPLPPADCLNQSLSSCRQAITLPAEVNIDIQVK
ncbi:MAG: hypothetical protein DRP65_01510 [Planctomycetota bacterium]|nr:MAG: hypothetical protein DRP65_01510 [Planctomycetota bacterium]